jgi:malonyl-CoA/methylmalonyl-CoA synthetase
MSNRLFDRLLAAAAADPDAIAIQTASRRFSYGDLASETARLANTLHRAGVSPGDRVAVQVEKSAENLLLYLATLRAGAVYVPLNTAYTLNELAYFIADAEPTLIVCDPTARISVAGIGKSAKIETLDAKGQGTLTTLSAQHSARFQTVARAPEDLAAICYTSGTTGRSKGAMLSHEALASNAETLTALWRFSSDDVLIHALPIYHVHGLFVATHLALMAGASMIFHPRFDPDAIIAAMPSATCLMGVPTFYTRLLNHPRLNESAVAKMRLFVSGSAPLLAQTHTDWRMRTRTAILERYGMTETGMNTSNPYDGERRAGTVGFPLPGVALRIVEEQTGEPVPQGVIGMIEVKGPNVCAGYWRSPDKTIEAFRPDGWFITGDLGVVSADGYVSIVGRGKDLIISGGLNVYPKEVEALIDALDGVVESAVIGLPHADLGEAVTAIVVRSAGHAATELSIVSALEANLAKFKRPRRVLFAADLPRNAMGKVQKAILRSQYSALYAS